MTYGGEPLRDGFEESPRALPVLASVIQQVSPVSEALNQLAGQSRLPDSGDSRYQYGARLVLKKSDHVLQLVLPAEKAAGLRQVVQRGDELLLDVLGQIPLNQFSREGREVDSPSVVDVPEEIDVSQGQVSRLERLCEL